MTDEKSTEAAKAEISKLAEEADAEVSEISPPEKAMRAFMAAFSGPATHPLAEKITSDHITTMLESDRIQNNNILVDRKDQRRTRLLMAGFGAGLVVAIVALLVLTGNVDRVEAIIEPLIYIAAGGIGGYGLGKLD